MLLATVMADFGQTDFGQTDFDLWCCVWCVVCGVWCVCVFVCVCVRGCWFHGFMVWGFTCGCWFQGFGLVVFGTPGTALPGTALPEPPFRGPPFRGPPFPGPPFPWTALPLDRPSPGPPKISLFFSRSRRKIRSFLPSLGVVSWNFGGVFEGRDPLMCPFGFSGCRVKPRRLRGRRGFTRQPENPNVHI